MESQIKLIGQLKVLSPLSKIRDNAVHVGLSLQQVLLKELPLNQLVNSSLSLNNSLLTVHLAMEIMDAKED